MSSTQAPDRAKLSAENLSVASDLRELLIEAQREADNFHVGDDPWFIRVPGHIPIEYIDNALGYLGLTNDLILVPADGLRAGYYIGPARHFRI